MKPLVIIRHVDYERLGWIPEILEELNIPYQSLSLSKGDAFPVMSEISGVISMGGPMSAYQLEEFPFLEEEMSFQRKLVKNDIPLLGICLGAQIMSQAFGAKVSPGTTCEMGWLPLTRVKAADEDPLFKGLHIPELFQLHYDVFDLPDTAVRLLKSDLCENQAFRLTEKAYGLQFHPEANPEMISSVSQEYRPKLSDLEMKLIEADPETKSQNGRAFLKEIITKLFL